MSITKVPTFGTKIAGKIEEGWTEGIRSHERRSRRRVSSLRISRAIHVQPTITLSSRFSCDLGANDHVTPWKEIPRNILTVTRNCRFESKGQLQVPTVGEISLTRESSEQGSSGNGHTEGHTLGPLTALPAAEYRNGLA